MTYNVFGGTLNLTQLDSSLVKAWNDVNQMAQVICV